jgi:hypothetical protein
MPVRVAVVHPLPVRRVRGTPAHCADKAAASTKKSASRTGAAILLSRRREPIRAHHGRDAASVAAVVRAAVTDSLALKHHPHGETGLGTVQCPLRQPLREAANASGCFHCPSELCICGAFQAAFTAAVAECGMVRKTDGPPGRKDLCAKSLNPNFVSRLVREMRISADDTFFDFGSGNGSILFQVAAATGARCVGVELNEHNAEMSRQVWARLRPRLERHTLCAAPSSSSSSSRLDVTIHTGDVLDLIASADFLTAHVNKRTGDGPVILCSNMLWPRSVTHFVSERCRDMPVGTRICCFEDFYPHGRAVSQSRDREAFAMFRMRDYVWPIGAVEWAPTLEGTFFVHEKVANRADIAAAR